MSLQGNYAYLCASAPADLGFSTTSFKWAGGEAVVAKTSDQQIGLRVPTERLSVRSGGANDETTPIAAKLCFYFDVHIGTPVLFAEQAGTVYTLLAGGPSVPALTDGDMWEAYRRLGSDRPDPDLKRFLETDHPGEQFFELYRLAREAQEPIATHMVLYLILLALHGDAQPKVDEFIISKEPSVEMVGGARSGTQTKYTYLRNAVGHFRTTDLRSVRVEMHRVSPGLFALVRTALVELEQS